MSTEVPTKSAPRQSTISLPPARAEQLKALAATLNLSVADAIGHLIRKEIAAGVIDGSIPGVTVARAGDAVTFGFNGATLNMTANEAEHVVGEIRARAEGSELRQTLQIFLDTQAPDAGLRPIRIERKGTGVNIRIRDQMKSFSPALARELADLIEATAA
jgi:hypothetical protein